jgi:S-adenosylmethionine decarboxylase
MEINPSQPLILGRHAILDLWGCSQRVMQDTALLRDLAFKAAELAQTTVLGSVEKTFEPQGYTIVLLLAESHLSLHTWPEHGFASIDLYSCNLQTDFKAVCNFLEVSLEAQSNNYLLLDRKFPEHNTDPNFSMYANRNGGAHVENGINFEKISLKRDLFR